MSSSTGCTSRLGNCDVCKETEAKYTCPGCDIKSCSLPCVKYHKEFVGCDGVRQKTAYKHISEFNNIDLLNDYRLLEDLARSADAVSKAPVKQIANPSDHLPHALYALREAAKFRNITLFYLPKTFAKRKENTSYFNWKINNIFWKVEWCFQVADMQTNIISNAVKEHNLLKNCISGILKDNNSECINKIKELDIDKLIVLLVAERIQRARKRYFKLDITKSLKHNLTNHAVVEYPTLIITLPEYIDNYCITTIDEVKEEILEARKRNIELQEKIAKLTEEKEDLEIKRPPKLQKLDIPSYTDLCKQNEEKVETTNDNNHKGNEQDSSGSELASDDEDIKKLQAGNYFLL